MARAYFVLMAYNEEDSLLSVIESIEHAALPKNYERRIIVVDDGSADQTRAVAERASRKYSVHILSYETRQGMPISFQWAFEYLGKHLGDDDIVFTLEADGTNDIACVPHMVDEIQQGADVVIASRYAPGAASLGFPWYRLWGSSLVNWLLQMAWDVPNVKDYSVLYRAYRGSILRRYIPDLKPFRARKSFAVIAEIALQLSHYTSKFAEVPLRYDYGLKKGKSKMKLFQTLWEYTRITPRTPLLRQPIFWIAVGAFALRVWGISYGFPDLLAGDEPALTRGALTMLKLHTLIPALHPADFATMYYPPLTAYLYLVVLAPVMGISYLLSGAHSTAQFAVNIVLNPTVPWMATRAMTALVGAFTVYCIGRLSEKIYAGSGVFAALFLATSFSHVMFSHIGRHWALSMLLIVGLVWTAYHVFHSGKMRWYVLSGIFAGLAVGNGVITGALLLVPILAHFFRTDSFVKKVRSASLWMMIAVSIFLSALFFALHPLILHNLLPESSQGVTIAQQKSLLAMAEMYVTELRDLSQNETMLVLFALIGVPLYLRRHPRFGSALAASVLLVIAVNYFFHYYLLHYVNLIVPILVLFAAAGAQDIVAIGKRAWARAAILALIFIVPLSIALRFSYLWTQPDTRHDARAYIEKNIPEDARVITYTPNIKVVWPAPEMLRERLAFDPASSRVTDTTLLSLATSTYPAPAFTVFELGTLSGTGAQKLTPKFLQGEAFDYAVVDLSATPYPALEALLANGEVMARFPADGKTTNLFEDRYEGPSLALFDVAQLGPEILVVKLKR